ncbi:hypothetical protein [Novosphingobium sp. Fuku2-ISO-50]|nr:hypothetical protein [Novosphingobium sp. Fuku2-ISO-50]
MKRAARAITAGARPAARSFDEYHFALRLRRLSRHRRDRPSGVAGMEK